jgi:hypothetical protein
VNINLHLTDDTKLRAHGFVADSRLFAEIEWDLRGPFPDSRGDSVLWGTPEMMRRLAELAIQAAVQAEEEAAAWQAHAASRAPIEGAQVA